jgi:hypothetical protein
MGITANDLTQAQRDALAAVKEGGYAPEGRVDHSRLLTLKRHGLVTRERTADGETWTAATAAKPNARRRKTAERAKAKPK